MAIDSSPPPAFIAFCVFWISLGLAGAIFYRKASYETKKFWHPIFVIAAGIIFFAFTEFASGGKTPVFFVIAIALITYLNLRSTRFCPRCGKTLTGRLFAKAKFCSKCGASLDEEDHRDNRPIG